MTAHGQAREVLVAHARNMIARGSRSFALASKLFDPDTRERAWLLYAWCRACDDLADGQNLGHGMSLPENAAERLALIRERTHLAFAGKATGDASFDCLGQVASETAVTEAMADMVIEGFALDAADWRPRTRDDMLRYCHHVAGAVGEMMAVVMGVDPADHDTLRRAVDLGLAFQLANIARDIEEDDRVGRCYLPVEWLVEMDIAPGQHMKPFYRSRLAVLVRRLGELALAHEASARIGAQRLPFRSRWAVLAAAGIYGQIVRNVVALGDHAWDHRTIVGKRAKLGWLYQGWRDARTHIDPDDAAMAREGLWTPRHLAEWPRPPIS